MSRRKASRRRNDRQQEPGGGAPDAEHDYGADIYAEAEGSDDTLANLGPLGPLAGIWTVYGILSNPFLDRAFQLVPGRDGLVDHVDRNRLERIAAPTPNPFIGATP